MATTHPSVDRSTGGSKHDVPDDETRHCKEDALSSKQFELLCETTYDMDRYYSTSNDSIFGGF